MYFLSDAMNAIITAKKHSESLYELQDFTTIFFQENTQIIDFWWGSYDVAVLKNVSHSGGLLVGVVDADTLMLAPQNSQGIYGNTILGYRNLSAQELSTLAANPATIFSYRFFTDKVFPNLHVQDLQLTHYNSGELLEFSIALSPLYIHKYAGSSWREVPQNDIVEYTFVF